MHFAAILQPYAWLWWTAGFLYNPLIKVAQGCAPTLKPHTPVLRTAWGLWNLCFSAFSLLGFLATWRTYVAMLGSFVSLCDASSPAAASFWEEHYISGSAHTWVLLFIVSKLFELGDTLFLALLGKPIIFLHWYHHLTILVYMFLGGMNWHPFMISGVAWNYCVHTVMYAYYASSCFNIKWPKWLARNITTLQLTQMFANLVLLAATFALCGCNHHVSAWPTVAMYTVYACLFLDLFRQKYTGSGKTVAPCTTTDKAAAETESPRWESFVTIDGFDYDITYFKRRHPGGGVIKHYIGVDASAAFKEFHNTSTKASLVLQSLPKRRSAALHQVAAVVADCAPASCADTAKKASVVHSKTQTNGPAPEHAADDTSCSKHTAEQAAAPQVPQPVGYDDAAIMADFAAWRDSLEARGLFKPRPIWQLLWFLSEPIILVAAACWVMHMTGSTLLGVLLLSLASTRTGWIQHEGGHNSLTRINKVDKIIQTFATGLGLSTSGWVWNSMHNKHHASPNKINYDIDLNTLPLVAFYKGCVEKDKMARGTDKPLLYAWLRTQAYTFLPVTCMAVSVLWFTILHPMKAWKKDKLGLAVMAVSQVARPALFVVFGSTTILQGFLLNMLSFWFTSMYMFGHFALSHTFMPVVEEDANLTWVRHAMEHSVDISPGNWLVGWVMGHLNYQVIHHLFPSMPQCYGPIVSCELRVKAQEWGIKYTTMPYFAAWKAMLANLDDVGAHYYTEAAITRKVA